MAGYIYKLVSVFTSCETEAIYLVNKEREDWPTTAVEVNQRVSGVWRVVCGMRNHGSIEISLLITPACCHRVITYVMMFMFFNERHPFQ